jgi:hypothetical protein
MSSNDVLVIEQDSTSYNSLDVCTYLTIGFIYAVFLSLLVDRILNYNRVEQVCDTKGMMFGTTQYNTRQDACEKAKTDYNSKKFAYMVVIGFLSVLGGAYVARLDDKYMTGGSGVAFGGLLTVIYFVIYNWTNLNKDFQIFILGLTFAGLLYGSTRM